MKKAIASMALLCAISSLCFGKEREKFVVGTTSGYAPFVSLNIQGEYEGFDIDLAKLIAERIGCELVIKDFGTMPSLMIALDQKKVDALIWAISITPKRENAYRMVYYQGAKEETMPFVFWKSAPEVSSIEDLLQSGNGAICVEAGSYQNDVMDQYAGASIKYTDTINNALLDLKYGKARAACIDPELLSVVKEKMPNLSVVYLPLPEEMVSMGNGICINRDNAELEERISKVVSQLINDGSVAQLEKKWGLKS